MASKNGRSRSLGEPLPEKREKQLKKSSELATTFYSLAMNLARNKSVLDKKNS